MPVVAVAVVGRRRSVAVVTIVKLQRSRRVAARCGGS